MKRWAWVQLHLRRAILLFHDSLPRMVATLLGIAALIVTLVVADLHRRQIRQVELQRADPSVPLLPPTHPTTRFLRTIGPHLWNIGVSVYIIVILVREVRLPTPPTRVDVLMISFSVLALVGTVLVELGSIAFDLGRRQGRTGQWL
jgi:hypothetical protein